MNALTYPEALQAEAEATPLQHAPLRLVPESDEFGVWAVAPEAEDAGGVTLDDLLGALGAVSSAAGSRSALSSWRSLGASGAGGRRSHEPPEHQQQAVRVGSAAAMPGRLDAAAHSRAGSTDAAAGISGAAIWSKVMGDRMSNKSASAGADRAVVNGAASVSAVPASVPSAGLWGEGGAFARFTRAAQDINRIARECREISAKQALARGDARAIHAAAYLRGVEAAYDAARGINADMCSTPGTAYRCMLDAVNKLRHAAEAQAIEARRGETTGLDGNRESAVGNADAPETTQEGAA
jgi:hypothetical protein